MPNKHYTQFHLITSNILLVNVNAVYCFIYTYIREWSLFTNVYTHIQTSRASFHNQGFTLSINPYNYC